MEAKQIKEEKKLSNDEKRQQEMTKLLQDFVDSTSILDAQIDGVFSQKKDEMGDVYEQKKFSDINGLMQLSRYSNVKHDLLNILQGSKLPSNQLLLPSTIDQSLLGDDIAIDFGLLINQFLIDKTQEVQVSTTKKALRHFVKNKKFSDAQI